MSTFCQELNVFLKLTLNKFQMKLFCFVQCGTTTVCCALPNIALSFVFLQTESRPEKNSFG